MVEPLWAPWRLGYIKGDAEAENPPHKELDWLPGADESCFLCRGGVDDDQRGMLVVEQSPHALVILNRFPYNNGHLLVAPRLHKAGLDDLSNAEHLDCMQALNRMIQRIQESMHPDGFNIGLNLGRVAGAGVPGHLHWHLVPRWSGDTNFMPVLAGAKVIPQSLEALWEMLRREK